VAQSLNPAIHPYEVVLPVPFFGAPIAIGTGAWEGYRAMVLPFADLIALTFQPMLMTTITILRTDSSSDDFQNLIKLLDAHLAVTDEDEHDFYNQYNGTDSIKHVVLAYTGETPVGCGAVKHYDKQTVEVKRMFTSAEHRGKGIAVKVLNELEAWAVELGYSRCLLETGRRQPYAIRLYEKQGYAVVPNFGQYAGMENSVCMEKEV
jgi:GNAT superfamily N-acetyltransferase